VESLGEYTTHHLDEEETVIFPMAEQIASSGKPGDPRDALRSSKTMLLGITLPPVAGKSRRQGRKALIGAKKKEAPVKPAAVETRTLPPDLGIGSLRKITVIVNA